VARYDSYLLRIWRSTRRDGRQLTFRLEHLQGGESLQGVDPADLIAYIQALCVDAPDPTEAGAPLDDHH
jgi:hypothetical protein